ncbi:MAG: biotin--[acetyl-CoA-carboxylase] ligase [Pseudomonadota bacterium]
MSERTGAAPFRIERVAEVTSTMDAAHRAARGGATEGLWVLADRQTQGRGRRGRSWLAPEGALTTTLLLRPLARRPELGPAAVATLSFIAALSLRDALIALGVGADIALKWPNDVLVGGGKIAGILLESEGAGGPPAKTHLAVGIGVNLAAAPEAADLEPGAVAPTCVADHGVEATPEAALALLSDAFAPRYERWLSDGFVGQRAEWLAAAAGRGKTLEAKLGARTITGVFDDVDLDGALVLRTRSGVEKVLAADVQLGA